MRAELKRLQREVGRTLIYVTHDQVEAMSMPDRVAVLREGAVQQVDSPENIYHRPASRFVATVIGSPPMNFVPAVATWVGAELELRHELFTTTVSAPASLASRLSNGAACQIGVRPEDIHVSSEAGIPAKVYVTEPLGGETVVDLDLAGRLVKALVPPTLALEEGESVQIALDGERLHLFDESGIALLSAAGEPLFSSRAASPGG